MQSTRIALKTQCRPRRVCKLNIQVGLVLDAGAG